MPIPLMLTFVFPCAEYRDLKKAVQSYEAAGGSARPAAQ